MQEKKKKGMNSGSSSSSSSSCSSSDDRGSSSKSGLESSCRVFDGLYKYEPIRAGGVYEQMLHAVNADNNSNMVPSIQDVQVHLSKTGQHTRVETEIQPTGATADLNINIIMDSDSNFSNAMGGQGSIEYESADRSGVSDEASPQARGTDNATNLAVTKSTTFSQANYTAKTGKKFSSDSGSPDNGRDYAGSATRPSGSFTTSFGLSLSPDSEGSSIKTARYMQAGQKGASESSSVDGAARYQDEPSQHQGDSDDDGNGDEYEDEGGEGEEVEVDDALRHFKRYMDGENVDAMRGPVKDDEAKEVRRRLSVGHLEKEGMVIGCIGVFADVHIKEFIIFLSDEMIQAFLVDPGRFRSVASRTKCEIEVTRRILNRRMGSYRWLKYLIVDIRGPSYSAIDQCDKMMSMLFPPYKNRKPYGTSAVVSMFLKETTPDNTDLYFNYQRTGASQRMFGEISLRAPYRKTKNRTVESTPWKAVQKRQQWGSLEPKNDRMEMLMSHVYPERGGTCTNPIDYSIKWAEAAEHAVAMSKTKEMARTQLIKSRKAESEPLYANGPGE